MKSEWRQTKKVGTRRVVVYLATRWIGRETHCQRRDREEVLQIPLYGVRTHGWAAVTGSTAKLSNEVETADEVTRGMQVDTGGRVPCLGAEEGAEGAGEDMTGVKRGSTTGPPANEGSIPCH